MRQIRHDYSVSLNEIELLILDNLTQGLSNREIGEKIGVTDKVVSIYIKMICEKRGYRNRVEAATERVKEIISEKLKKQGVYDIEI